MKLRPRYLAAGTATVALVIAATASAGGGLGRRVAISTDNGPYPAAVVSAYVERPRRFALRVEASYSQPVEVDYDLYCTKGDRSRSTHSHRRLAAPAVDHFRPNIAKADDCTPSAVASTRRGRLRAELFVKHR
jgi:hypothetical protein